VNYPKPKNGKAPPPKVDASGEFPSGEIYEDFAGFKKIIRQTRIDLFARHLIKQMLSYASGRQMGAGDEFVIDDVLGKVKSQGFGLSTLLEECFMSEMFRSR
jgi:hypothetical protein